LLTAEFQKAFEYTKGLIGKDLPSIIVIVASLIPFINIFVLMRYVDKIVSEPSNSTKPPKLVNPNWTELLISLIKIILVGLVWGIIAIVLLAPVGFIIGRGALGGATSLMNLVEKLQVESLPAGIIGFIILVIVGLFAIMSEVNMFKRGKSLNAAFAFRELMDKIQQIGWVRYLLYTFSLLVVWAIAIFITSQSGNYIEFFSLSVLGILTLFIGTFFAKTVSVMYDGTAHPDSPQ
jgi:hypothetical protein